MFLIQIGHHVLILIKDTTKNNENNKWDMSENNAKGANITHDCRKTNRMKGIQSVRNECNKPFECSFCQRS